ncbi:MAG: GTPase HflX [Thermoprotei archaeon]|nr:MAG: GTPase HflX [Thermoprotei archaeon]
MVHPTIVVIRTYIKLPRRTSWMSAILVECQVPGIPPKIEELEDLARSRGYFVLKKLIQRRGKPDAAYVIGRGKLAELKRLVMETGADNVIFANTLKAGQAFRIRRELGWRVNVIDRNLLVLEIFEQRAMTKEAKLQIELARLRYTLPWAREFVRYRNLYGEQVGFSAMGEYLHKVYEANARRRIKALKEELRKARLKTFLRVKKRHEAGLPVVSLTGYTQAGKTTFFNLVAGESKPVGLGLFTTLSTFARRISIEGMDFIIVDSIGFIEDLHPLILDAFHATLSEIGMSDAILLIIDASDPPDILRRKVSSSKEVLYRVAPGLPLIIALNKVDLVGEEGLEAGRRVVEDLFPSTPIIPISARRGDHVEEVLLKLKELLMNLS